MDVRHVSYLTDISHPVLQYLMAWVMCCCVERDASTNCTLIVRYIGINLLTDIISDVMTNDKVKVLLEQVVRSCGERGNYVKTDLTSSGVLSDILPPQRSLRP